MTFQPTPEQSAIEDFIAENPDTNVMLEAVAGAAKTTTVVRAANRISTSRSGLALAFNKRNATDLAERMPPHFVCKSLNALGHQAWGNRLGKRLTLDDDKLFKLTKARLGQILEPAEDDLQVILTLVRTAKSIGLVPQGAPMGVRGMIEDVLSEWEEIAFVKGISLGNDHIAVARGVLLDSIKSAFQGEIDFADQIYMSTLFGGTFPKYDDVIVDEAQDLSSLNHKMLQKCTKERLIAVGDPHQAIYAFRGADSESMSNLATLMGGDPLVQARIATKIQPDADYSSAVISRAIVAHSFIGKGKFKRLMLTKSFRVAKAIGRRQIRHVPHFGTMDWLPEGEVLEWPIPYAGEVDDTGLEPTKHWSIDDIPAEAWVLCRNNAPLMRLAFAMLKKRRPVRIMGRDIGTTLANQLLKATGKGTIPSRDCFAKIDEWKARELDKCGDSESKRDIVFDRCECMVVMLQADIEHNKAPTNQTAAAFIRELFSDKAASDCTLSSGHRAKGMEAPFIVHLDPFRIPSKWARKAADYGDLGPITQERNLQYVIETRSQGTLVLANLDDCLEIGE